MCIYIHTYNIYIYRIYMDLHCVYGNPPGIQTKQCVHRIVTIFFSFLPHTPLSCQSFDVLHFYLAFIRSHDSESLKQTNIDQPHKGRFGSDLIVKRKKKLVQLVQLVHSQIHLANAQCWSYAVIVESRFCSNLWQI